MDQAMYYNFPIDFPSEKGSYNTFSYDQSYTNEQAVYRRDIDNDLDQKVKLPSLRNLDQIVEKKELCASIKPNLSHLLNHAPRRGITYPIYNENPTFHDQKYIKHAYQHKTLHGSINNTSYSRLDGLSLTFSSDIGHVAHLPPLTRIFKQRNLVEHSSNEYAKQLTRFQKPLLDFYQTTTELKPFKCSQCRQRFGRSHDLKRHNNIHLNIKPYKCSVCDKSFTRLDALKRHQSTKRCKLRHCTKNSSTPCITSPNSISTPTDAFYST